MKRQQVEYRDSFIYWRFNNETHRDEDLPAAYYFMDGKIEIIYFQQHGKYHRATGPAYINYKYKTKRYYYQGKQYASLEEIQMVEVCR